MKFDNIQICDCTIRDGGLVNDSQFSVELVHHVYRAAAAAGVDIIELGYKNNREMLRDKRFGCWRFCDENMLRMAVSDIKTDMKVAVMQDAHKARARDLLPREKSVVDIVRIATYVRDLDKAIHLTNSAADKGYTTFVNIMAISQVKEQDLIYALDLLKSRSHATGYYIVDSFGSFYPHDIDHYVTLFRDHLGDADIGIHCHNQQQLAFSNTLRAVELGATFLDATLYGLGRAAGNCPIELMVGYLNRPGMDIRPLLEVIGSHILPLRDELEWGYTIPHMLTGLLNLHPRSGIRQMELDDAHPDKLAFGRFYDRISTPDGSAAEAILPKAPVLESTGESPEKERNGKYEARLV